MTNPYFLQLIGILLAVAGLAALTASAYIYGRPLTHDERFRTGQENRNTYRLPINLATVAATAFALVGIGVLAWTKFDICSYLNYWLPNLPEGITFFLSCR